MANHYKSSSTTSYALGTTIVLELIRIKPQLVRKIFLNPSLDKTSKETKEIILFCEQNNIETIESRKPFNILSPKGNTFIIAEFEKTSQNLEPDKNHVVLVNPSDAGNIGTIVRSAIGFGYQNIAIIGPSVDIFSPKSVRASMGAIFHIKVHHYDNTDEYINEFPNHKRYAFMLRNATDFSKAQINTPFSFIFGNEATGLPDTFAEICTPVKIPQSDKIDSLSLPMAATIAMYAHRKC